MLVISKVNEITKSFIKILFSVNDPKKAVQCAPYGFDSKPIDGVQAVMGTAGKKNVIVGYLYESEETVAGEPRMYATDENGELLGSVKLNQDSEIVLNGGTDYAVAYLKLEEKLQAFEATFNTHIHTTTATVGATPAVGVIAPTTSQSAENFEAAKVEKVRI